MKRGPDDDALSWGDESDPTYVAPDLADNDPAAEDLTEANRVAVSVAKVRQSDAAEDTAAEDELADAEEASAQLSSAALITFGVVGGVFFLYTIGWLVAFIRNPLHPGGFAETWQDVQGVAAIAAPALWFSVTLLLAAGRRVAVRLIWLLVGLVVVVPWPFILGV